ncbi:Fanconi anemia core complex-associated protein 24-like isoform X1 [Portunus trituberculatus]|uniref:Fanconi anemia core complex-associated protein 24-like isoform X1 n=1 Tax=Portunus trituberculatus TaxID=210409 RepID=UPI001E1CE0F3|nr:Fanconi anemia core complex-associated protein 24-like isoform X1 [Portunus trituberculatus]XP_045122997.1 Fanconi anemia core complex-associated protein 24-like isoform X1 [Portunus trituberculatus]XP_045122998.1 Fanconi anemia core complex-associated protein 24-like isoform X1 [Portunus trituberculatus]XP_045122999.1 Fanconi anemia core complex-associated protein 24-like isoform X1 [Portunus trituberculatus]XP_045123000.1 Fanconi anemia core complex-associated protein 24-like isoform X1 [P
MMSRGVGGSQTPLVVASLWRDTQLATLLRPLIPLSYREDLGEADFLVSKNAAVIFIAEADIISGGGFRRRAVKFRQSSSITAKRRVVVLQKTPLTAQHFSNVQKFISIDLGLPIVPVQSLQETAQLLVRMVASETKIRCNPLCKQPQKAGNQDQQLLQSLTSVVPCLGMQRARALLARFGTLQDLAQAPRTAMEEVVGRAAAASVHEFLNGRA